MWAPVVEIADVLGQELLQMALIQYEHVVQALRPDRSHPTLGDRVGPRRSERRANLGNTEITDPPIEAGAITAVAIMNEKAARGPNRSIRQSAVPSTRWLDAASRERAELPGWRDGSRRTRTAF